MPNQTNPAYAVNRAADLWRWPKMNNVILYSSPMAMVLLGYVIGKAFRLKEYPSLYHCLVGAACTATANFIFVLILVTTGVPSWFPHRILARFIIGMYFVFGGASFLILGKAVILAAKRRTG